MGSICRGVWSSEEGKGLENCNTWQSKMVSKKSIKQIKMSGKHICEVNEQKEHVFLL